MGKVLGFISIKGGVGKTTLALETATSLVNDFGKKVLLVDANFSAPNLGLYLDLTQTDVGLHDALLGIGLHNSVYEKNGVDVVPADLNYKEDVDIFRLSKVLGKMRNRYDFIILDSSPNYDELVPVVNACDKIFVVTTPDLPTLTTTMKAAQLAKSKKTPIEGMIINRIRNPKYELSLNDVESAGGIPVVARIKDDKNMVKALHFKEPIVLHKRNSNFSEELRRFASALCGVPGEKGGFFSNFFPLSPGKEKINRELMRKKFYEAQL